MNLSKEEISIIVGGKIRMRRKLLGLTQTELSKMLGLSFQQVQKYEHGKNEVSASILYKLSFCLCVEISFFFDNCLNVYNDQPKEIVDTRYDLYNSINKVTDLKMLRVLKELIDASASKNKQE